MTRTSKLYPVAHGASPHLVKNSSPQAGPRHLEDMPAAPLVHLHYKGFIATAGNSAPCSNIGILPHGVSHLSFPFVVERKEGSWVPYQSLY